MENKLKYIPKDTALRIRELFKSLAKDYIKLVYEEEKEICSFGIFTDSDISNFLFGYNTKEGMDIIIEDGIKNKKEFPDTKLETDSMKWWIPEWMNGIDEEYFMDDPREKELFETFEKLIDQTENPDEDLEDENFSNYKEDIFDLFCQLLKELKEENTFTNVSKDFFLLVQEDDNGVYKDKVREKSLLRILDKKQIENLIVFEKGWFSIDY